MTKHQNPIETQLDAEFSQMGQLQEVLSDVFNIKLILYMMAYGEQSLTELTELVNKSKPTVSRRMKILLELAIVEEVEKEGRAKYFKVNYSIIQNHLTTYLNPEIMDSLNSEVRMKIFRYILSFSRNTVTLLQQMLDLVQRYTRNFEEQKAGVEIENMGILQKWVQEYTFTIRMWPMSEELLQLYLKEYTEFVGAFQQKHSQISNEMQGDYLLWSLLIPTKKILP